MARRRCRHPLVASLLLLSSLLPTPTMAVVHLSPHPLLPRADAPCGGISGLVQCQGGFPSDFCCPTASKCVGFNGNKAVICCPGGGNCDGIAPTSCDPTFYNATLHPENPLHLSEPSASPKPCGGGCCAAGYTCNSKNFCVLNALASASAAATSTATAATVTSPASATATGGNSAPAAAGAAAASGNCPAFPIMPLLVGLGAGLVGGAVLTLLFIWCLGRWAQRRDARAAAAAGGERHRSGGDDDSLGPTAAKVSDPIYVDHGGATRTDFLRYASMTRRAHSAEGGGRASRPRSSLHSGFGGAGAGARTGTNSTTVAGSSDSSPVGRVRSLFSRTPTLAARARWEKMGEGADGRSPPLPSGGIGGVGGGIGGGAGGHEMAEVATPPRQIRREPSLESIKIYSPPDARQTTFGDMIQAAHGTDARGRAPPPGHGGVPAVPPLNFGGPVGLDARLREAGR